MMIEITIYRKGEFFSVTSSDGRRISDGTERVKIDQEEVNKAMDILEEAVNGNH